MGGNVHDFYAGRYSVNSKLLRITIIPPLKTSTGNGNDVNVLNFAGETVGDDAVISRSSVVTKDVILSCGCPSILIRMRFGPAIIEKLS